MCLLIFAHRADPDYPLVIAANRDEFHAHPTAAADFWPEHPMLLAGRDLEQGGTWMGVPRTGRFAAITNYRDPARTPPAPRSRGELPLDFLVGDEQPDTFLEKLCTRAGEYAGFNLLVGDGENLWYFSNSATDSDPRRLLPGIYGLSNARLDTPWPKVEVGKHKLRSLLETGEVADHQRLATVVSDRQTADPQDLLRQGLNGEMDQLLSAQFIVTGRYGTRSSTTLWRDKDGHTHWQELSYDPAGRVQNSHQADMAS